MAVQTAITVIDAPAAGSKIMFFTKEFLKNTLGWTVAGSGDGTTGGMDAVDRILTESQFESVLTNWLVIESPDGLLQILFTKDGQGTDNFTTTYMNPEADYTGGNATTKPTSPSGAATIVFGPNDDVISTLPSRFHACGSDTDPYWWAVAGTALGTPSSGSYSSCCIKLENTPASSGCPYWVFVQEQGTFNASAMDTQSGSSVDSRGLCQANPGDPPEPAPATLYVRDGSSQVIPNAVTLDNNLADLSFPVVFASNSGGSGFYFGTTDIMRWNGTSRDRLITFAGKTRIILGDVSFPWDGTTVPIP